MLPASAIAGEHWSLADTASATRTQTMMRGSTPLGEYVNGQIYYGIKTGFNKAFVIDGAQRAALIAADPQSAEIIKPLVVGKDIRRWVADYKDQWLIFTRRGIRINDYPAIKAYLTQWKIELTPKKSREDKTGRKPGGYKWYEIQDDVAYFSAFSKPKIVFPDIAKEFRLSFDSKGGYISNTAYCIGSDNLFLLGVLNSKVVGDYYENVSSQIRGGYLRFIRQYVERIPIPKASDVEQAVVAALVQQCLDAKGQGPQIAEWEAEIDARVTRLYGLPA